MEILRSLLYKSARLLGDVEALSKPKRAQRRAKNKTLGRLLGKGGLWHWLWK